MEQSIDKKENNFQILGEIIIHLIVISIVWYFLHKNLRNYLEIIMNIKIKEETQSTVGIVGSIALIGLQKNLIEKLEYITLTHPFRMKDFIWVDFIYNYYKLL